MSAEIEEQLLDVQQEEPSTGCSKKPQISYSREFLLSFSELEACKKLPKDFDESLLSEFHEASYYGAQDRPRAVGGPLQGFRRTDYSSSPPARGDSGNVSRGPQRWDSRSSGRSDGDSDSEPGRRYGTQSRRSWQNSEHDGLLGSGSFPRPPGYTAAAVPRFRPNENVHLSKSNEPYHPPRPYKAVPHSRRETHDSLNDETFGSADSTNEDRAEEEKKRRAEFEIMREEAHKAFQEKQKSNSGKPKDSFSNLAGLLENPDDGKISSDLDKTVKEAPQGDSGKLPVSSQVAPIRPLVPPGFVSSVVDKSSSFKPPVLQVGNLETVAVPQDVKGIAKERGSSDLHPGASDSSEFKAQKGLLSIVQGVDQVNKIVDNGEVLGLDSDINGHKVLAEPVRSASLLDKLFGNAVTSSEITSDVVEPNQDHDPKADGIWSPDKLQSKFARWFLEEESKTPKGISSEKPSSLLSLIIGGEKGASDGPNGLATGPILSSERMLGQNSLEPASSISEIADQFGTSIESEPKPSVLTCEDLEQSILLEIGDVPSSLPPEKKEDALKVKHGHPGIGVDNLASQHLLSLLQRGTSSNNAASISSLDKRYPEEDHEMGKLAPHDGNSHAADTEGSNSSDKALTLESLFGTAFMNELHSAQRNSVGSARMNVADGANFAPKMSKNGNGGGHDEGSILASSDGVTNLENVADWLGILDTAKEVAFSRLPAQFDSNLGGFDGVNRVKLPEEDSFVHLIDPVSTEKSFFVPNSSSFNADLMSSSSNMPDNVIEKLASLGGAIKDESSIVGGQDQLLFRSSYDMGKPEPPYQNLHPQVSSPQLHSSLMNHGRALFHPLESHPAHLDPHLKFMPPETVVHRDTPIHHQFSSHMGHPPFPHPNAGLPGFDHPIPPPVLQQMRMAGNLPPPHLVRGFPGGAPMPTHPGHSPASFIQEHNPMQGFPFGQRPPNFGGPSMSPPGPEHGVGNNPPEAFQRLLEMEMRANPKQVHPFAAGGPNRGMYGHELDAVFRYR